MKNFVLIMMCGLFVNMGQVFAADPLETGMERRSSSVVVYSSGTDSSAATPTTLMPSVWRLNGAPEGLEDKVRAVCQLALIEKGLVSYCFGRAELGEKGKSRVRTCVAFLASEYTNNPVAFDRLKTATDAALEAEITAMINANLAKIREAMDHMNAVLRRGSTTEELPADQ